MSWLKANSNRAISENTKQKSESYSAFLVFTNNFRDSGTQTLPLLESFYHCKNYLVTAYKHTLKIVLRLKTAIFSQILLIFAMDLIWLDLREDAPKICKCQPNCTQSDGA